MWCPLKNVSTMMSTSRMKTNQHSNRKSKPVDFSCHRRSTFMKARYGVAFSIRKATKYGITIFSSARTSEISTVVFGTIDATMFSAPKMTFQELVFRGAHIAIMERLFCVWRLLNYWSGLVSEIYVLIISTLVVSNSRFTTGSLFLKERFRHLGFSIYV